MKILPEKNEQNALELHLSCTNPSKFETDCWYIQRRCPIKVNKYFLWKDDTNESAEITSKIWWDASQGYELNIKDTSV